MRFEVVFSVLTMFLFGSEAAADVRLTSDLEDNAISQDFNSGDVVPIEFQLAQDDAAPLFGCEVSMVVDSDALRIRSVSFNPAFSGVLGQEPPLPGGSFSTTRVQSLSAVNRSLGTSGGPVHFATVELEVLSDRPFESALIVKARGALVGKLPEATTVLGVAAGRGEFAEGRITIVGLGTEGPGDQGTEGVEETAVPWTMDEVPASMEVWPLGGRAPASVLAPNTAYELHYTADRSVNGFDLLVTTDGPEAEPPTFQACWEGSGVTDLPAEPATDRSDAWPARRIISADLGTAVGESGLLCQFVTGTDTASYRFDLHLYDIDPETRAAVEMPASAEFLTQ